MSLAGSFSTMSLGELLQWIEQGRKTGALTVHGERYVKRIFTRRGRVIASSSGDPNDHLGHVLLRLGLTSEPDLRRALEVQERSRAMLGEILVSLGAVEQAALRDALNQKAEETIFNLFLWRDARFEFQPDTLPVTLSLPVDLPIGDILMKGLTWFDELQHIRRIFASNRSVVARTERPMPEEAPGPESLERRILDLVDGRRCVADICLAVHASEFVVSRALHEFHERGLVTVIKEAPPGPAAPRKTLEGLLEEARSLLRAGEAEASLVVIEEARPLAPQDAALAALAREAQEAFTAEVRRDGLEPTSVPIPTRPLESLQGESLTPEQMFILTRADGVWDLRSIMSVCPFPEIEALMQLKRLKDRGIISLREPEG